MSAPQFTPGPWGIFENEERVVVAVGQIGEDEICEPLGDTPEQAEANTHLIAAAPSLYEALCAMVEWHIKRGPFDEPLGESEQEDEINAAVSALRKARGEHD